MSGPFTSKPVVNTNIINNTGTGIASYTAVTTPLPAVTVSYNVAHALGVIPASAVLELTCLTAELGYSVGDVVQVSGITNMAVFLPSTLHKTSTTVGIPIPSGYTVGIANKSTGATSQPTVANWSYRLALRKD